MFRIVTALVLLVASFLDAHPLRADTPVQAALDTLVQSYEKPDEPGFSVAVSVGGETVYSRWSGQADLAHKIPIDADTRYHIASLSKQFTAFAIMLLIDEGRISLNQDVRDFIPELEEKHDPVTIRHLLSHTSGLREANSLLLLTGRSEASPVTARQSLDLVFRQHGGNFPAGQREEYSNTGYQLLAEIVARVSGQSFPDFLQDRVFAPLGMTRTFVRTKPTAVIDDIASGYTPTSDGFVHEPLLSATYGSTGIISDPHDLLRWGHALNTGAIGGQGVIAAMAERTTLANGRHAIASNGQEYRNFRGLDSWSHGGSTGGFRSFLLRIPEQDVVVVVMSNRSDFLKAAFAFKVAEALLQDRLEPVEEPVFTPETGADLDRYVGDYRLFAGTVFSIRRSGDDLMFSSFGSSDGFAVPQVGKGSFLLDPTRELRLEFRDFEDGRASEMRWQISEDGFIRAPRVAMEAVPQTPIDIGELEGMFYSSSLQQVIVLSRDSNGLSLRSGTGERAALELYQPDTFRTVGETAVQRLKVVRTDNGAVSGLLVSTSLADDIEYRMVEE